MKEALKKFFKEQFISQIKVFIFILVLVLLTRFLFSYGLSPELRFKLDFANDINHSVFILGSNIADGNGPTATLYEANGLPFALGFAPFYLLFSINNFLVVYYSLIFITILGYLIFIFWLTKRDSAETKAIYVLFFLAFVLGVPGSAGIYMGNIDIILSLILGALMMNFIYKSVMGKRVSAVVEGFISALMSISKLFLLPFSLVFGIFSSAPLLYFLIFILSSLGFLYSPHIFGANMSILTFIESLVKFNQDYTVGVHTWGNHSLSAISTLFLNCADLKACSSSSLLFITEILLGFITIILPFTSRKTIKKLFGFGKLFLAKSLVEVDKKKLLLLLFVFINTVINLIPTISYEYRLFYSLPIVLILYKETGGNKKARLYCLLSMILLLLNGLWVTKFYDNDVGIFPAQFMNLFVLGHFYFMLKASIENLRLAKEYEGTKALSIENLSYLIIPLIFLVLFMFRFIPNTKGESQMVVGANNPDVITSSCISCNIVLPNGVVFPQKGIKDKLFSLPFLNQFAKNNYPPDQKISLLILKDNEYFYNLLQAYKNNNGKMVDKYYTLYMSTFSQLNSEISTYNESYFNQNTKYVEQRTYLTGQYNGLLKFLSDKKTFGKTALYKQGYNLLSLQLQALNLLENKIWETDAANNIYRGRLDVDKSGTYSCDVKDGNLSATKNISIDGTNYTSNVYLDSGPHKVEISYVPNQQAGIQPSLAEKGYLEFPLGNLSKGSYKLSFDYKSDAIENVILFISSNKISADSSLVSTEINYKNGVFIDTVRMGSSVNFINYENSFSVLTNLNKKYYFYILFPTNTINGLVINNLKIESKVDAGNISLVCKKQKN